MSKINVFSYNLRMDNPGDGINAFSKRKEYVLRTFPKYDADIIGFQEILPHMRQWLIDSFKDYEICGIGRGKQSDATSSTSFRWKPSGSPTHRTSPAHVSPQTRAAARESAPALPFSIVNPDALSVITTHISTTRDSSLRHRAFLSS